MTLTVFKKNDERVFALYKETGKQEYLSLYEQGWTFIKDNTDRGTEILQTLESCFIKYRV